MKFLRIATLAAFAGILLAPAVHADEWNKKTTLTINEPIRVPSCCNPDHSVTLQPGTYVIALVDSTSDRHIVRIFAEDGKTVITTILAIPNYRLKATSKSSFQFWEVPAGQTKAMRAWFYPGDNFGQEFAYPKDVAVELSAFVKAPVPVVAVQSEDELKTAEVAVVQPTGEYVAPVKVEAYVAPAPIAAPAADVAPAEVAPAEVTPEVAELPHTASTMPLIGLLGLLSLGAFAVSSFRFKRPV
jgi:LPXTG-motif cell wall-anchored protein